MDSASLVIIATGVIDTNIWSAFIIAISAAKYLRFYGLRHQCGCFEFSFFSNQSEPGFSLYISNSHMINFVINMSFGIHCSRFGPAEIQRRMLFHHLMQNCHRVAYWYIPIVINLQVCNKSSIYIDKINRYAHNNSNYHQTHPTLIAIFVWQNPLIYHCSNSLPGVFLVNHNVAMNTQWLWSSVWPSQL